jgi:ferredoxin
MLYNNKVVNKVGRTIMKIFYFTATGNSLFVAKQIGEAVFSVPQMFKNNDLVHESDAIGFVFPCYAFDIPNIIKDFLKQGKFKAEYFFAIMTYGSKSGSGLKNLEILANQYNIKFHYTNEIEMIDNYLPGFDINVQLRNEPFKFINKNLENIKIDIKCRKMNTVKPKGIFSRLLSFIVNKSFRITGKEDSNFSIDKSCTLCGTCSKVCPKGNITIGQKPIYHHNCQYCMACIHSCPITAIHIKSEKNSKRYRNPNTPLQELINSNNQQP